MAGQGEGKTTRPPKIGWLARLSRSVPLRSALVLAIVSQVVAAFAVTGTLWYEHSRDAVENLEEQVLGEARRRVFGELDDYIGAAYTLNHLTASSIRQGLLDPDATGPWRLPLLDRIRLYPQISLVGYISEDAGGSYRGVRRVAGQSTHDFWFEYQSAATLGAMLELPIGARGSFGRVASVQIGECDQAVALREVARVVAREGRLWVARRDAGTGAVDGEQLLLAPPPGYESLRDPSADIDERRDDRPVVYVVAERADGSRDLYRADGGPDLAFELGDPVAVALPDDVAAIAGPMVWRSCGGDWHMIARVETEAGGGLAALVSDDGGHRFHWARETFADSAVPEPAAGAPSPNEAVAPEPESVTHPYAILERGWYQDTIAAGTATWTEVYAYRSTQNVLGLTLTEPYVDSDGSVRGAVSVDITVELLGSFLDEQLQVGEHGEIFILDGDAKLVAASAGNVERGADILGAGESDDPLIRAAGQHLQGRIDPTALDGPRRLHFDHDGEEVLLDLAPYANPYGLEWTVAVVVPRADFTGTIEAGILQTVLWCLVGLVIATVIALLSVGWIARPVRRLSEAARRMAQGDLEQHVEVDRAGEIGELAQTFNTMATELSAMHEAMRRFVPHEFVDLLKAASIVDVDVGDSVLAEMTILFADIRGFTSLSEAMSSSETFDFVNDYLNEVGPAIRNHGGFIDKYMGDGIMALFTADSDHALEAAVKMQRCVEKLSEERVREGLPPLRIGVGCHSGPVILGIVGEHARLDSTVIGDGVNLASRLEGLTKAFGARIIVSKDTLAASRQSEAWRARYLGRVTVKGKNREVEIYEVYEGDPPARRDAKDRSREAFDAAVHAWTEGDLLEGARRFEEVLELDPDDAVARYLLRRCREGNARART